MTPYYAVLHIPTQTLFPLMKTGSTRFDFYDLPKRKKHKVKPAPRLFESARMAQRYITEYCKGIRNNDYFINGEAIKYELPERPRIPAEFAVVEIAIQFRTTNFLTQNGKIKETTNV